MPIAGSVVVGLYSKHITHGLQTSDSSAPSFTVGPATGVVTTSSVQVTGTVTDDAPPITVYAVVVTDGAGAPSSAQIQAGTDSADSAAPNDSDTVSSGSEFGLTIGGLTQATAYDLYYVAVDNSDNDSTPAKLDFTTTTPPGPSGTAPIAAIVTNRRRRLRK